MIWRVKRERERAHVKPVKTKSPQGRLRSKDGKRKSASAAARELAERHPLLTAEQIELEMERVKDSAQLEARLKEMEKSILATPPLSASGSIDGQSAKPARPQVDSTGSDGMAELDSMGCVVAAVHGVG